jgi:hypothetical protein
VSGVHSPSALNSVASMQAAVLRQLYLCCRIILAEQTRQNNAHSAISQSELREQRQCSNTLLTLPNAFAAGISKPNHATMFARRLAVRSF